MQKNMRTPKGITQTWRLWRHCLCRFGCYPLLVTPFVTLACAFALMSSIDCEYMTVSIGFTPTNTYWEKSSTLDVGLWFIQSHKSNEGLPWKETSLPGCRRFDTSFEELLLESDSTWSAARIGAMVSACASILALSTSILLNFCPLPVRFIWTGVLLPSVLTSLCAEAIKFLAFDSDMCKARIWRDSNGSYHSAEGCSLNRGAMTSLGSITTYLMCIILVCLKSPQRRQLDPAYGKVISTQGARTYVDLEEQDTMEAWSVADERSIKYGFSHEDKKDARLSVSVSQRRNSQVHSVNTPCSTDSRQRLSNNCVRTNAGTMKPNNIRFSRSESSSSVLRSPQSCKSGHPLRLERSTSWVEFNPNPKIPNPYRDDLPLRQLSLSVTCKSSFNGETKKPNLYFDEESQPQEQRSPNIVSPAKSSSKLRPTHKINRRCLVQDSSGVTLTPSTPASKHINYALNDTATLTHQAALTLTPDSPITGAAHSQPNIKAARETPGQQLLPRRSSVYTNYSLENTIITIPNRSPGENQSISGIGSEIRSPTSQALYIFESARKRDENRRPMRKTISLEALFQQQQQENDNEFENKRNARI